MELIKSSHLALFHLRRTFRLYGRAKKFAVAYRALIIQNVSKLCVEIQL